MHYRDFRDMREQRPLSELPADAEGFVRFKCLKCPRTGKVRLARLQERSTPDTWLVTILNTLLPKDCPDAKPNPWKSTPCGFCYRDLG